MRRGFEAKRVVGDPLVGGTDGADDGGDRDGDGDGDRVQLEMTSSDAATSSVAPAKASAASTAAPMSDVAFRSIASSAADDTRKAQRKVTRHASLLRRRRS